MRVGLGDILQFYCSIYHVEKNRDINRGFYKTCELTVLLKSFDLFTDLALQVPGFCLQ